MSRITIAGSEVSTMMSVLDMSLMDFQLVGPSSFLTLQNLVLVNKPTVPSLYNPLGLLTMLSNFVSCLGHSKMSTSCKSLSLRNSTSVQDASGSGALISLNNVTIVLPAQELKVIRCILMNSSMADSMTQPVVRRLMETYLKASQAMIVEAEQQDINVCSSLLLLPNKQMTHGRHQPPPPLRAAIPPGDVIFPTLMWPGVTGRQVTLTSSYPTDPTSGKALLSTNTILRAGHSTLAPNTIMRAGHSTLASNTILRAGHSTLTSNADNNVQRPSLIRDTQISVPHIMLQAAPVPSASTVRLVSLLPNSQSTRPSSRYYDPPSISPTLLPSSRRQTTAIVSWLLMVTANNHSFSEQSNIPRTASAGGRRFIMLISAHFPYAIYVLKICSVVVGLVLGLCLLYFVKRRMMEEGYTGPETLGGLVRYLLRKFPLYSLKSWWIFCCCCHDGRRTTSHLESNDVIRSAPSDVEVGLQVPHAPPARAAVPPEDERVDLLPSSSSPCLEDNEKCRSLLEDQESPSKDENANYLPKSKTMLQSFCEGIVVSDTEEHGSMQNALVNHNSIILLRRSVKKVLESQMEDLREELQLQNHRSVECVGSLNGGHRDYRDYPDKRLGSSNGSGACNEWELAGLLGKGGFGCVYKGTWRGLPVAVKRIVFQVLDDKQGDDQRQQTLREAAINEMVHHPCLVNTYTTDIHCLTDVNTAPIQGVMDWQMHIIMEYCDGGSLRDALDQDLLLYDLNVYIGSNSSQAFRTQLLLKMLQILKQVATGCAYLHSQNIFHGDLKPDNVLLKSIGTSADAAAAESQGAHVLGYQVKVADFGLSKNLHEMDSSVFSCSKLGTPAYTAPEILNDGRASKGADVYSFGVMMWELLWYTLWACQQRPSGPPNEDHTSRSAAGLSPGNWIWPKDDDTASGHQVGPSAEQLKDIPTYPFQLHRELSTVDVIRIRSDLEVTFDTASVPLSYRLIGLA
ncbi:hypothetical protein CEUSTIGMA_g5310.t1 [Chlamydomonas eustigma]|uniref:Protein kinase domain-containing protein n=1 Tax=Chlamydomonas eustigma TaxID=1157962 RepID=A0A250X458_9CHLO|nr:hypothetical protein CEUSTIGMA_g5310.t1 [Chlamydomonas eustigma]|eukprot:GAX77868.1 hypothetical protein CEUSTIGMA_g5310.t1 [Chlamydomonas eustigma]